MPSSLPLPESTLRRCRPWLGTFVDIAASGVDVDALERAFGRVAHVHARMSFHSPDSDIARLGSGRAGLSLRVDRDTTRVLAHAIGLFERSGGAFDVAVGARLVAAGYLPRPAGVDLRRMTGTAADIEIVDEQHVICHRPMLIDLGGIAKGYAVDCAVESLANDGATQVVVNAGGDLRIVGSAQVHRRHADGSIGDTVELRDAAMASSSNLHLRRRHAGREVAPHLDARRRPQLATHTVSVVAARCIDADALTKIALADPVLAERMAAEAGGRVIA